MKWIKGLRFVTCTPDRILTTITDATWAVIRGIAKAFGAGMTRVFLPRYGMFCCRSDFGCLIYVLGGTSYISFAHMFYLVRNLSPFIKLLGNLTDS